MKTKQAKQIIIGAIILTLVIFALAYCNLNPHRIKEPIIDTNPLNEVVKDKEAINATLLENNKVLRDSLFKLSQIKPKIVYRKIYIYDSLLIADTACIKSLVTLYKQCAKVDSVNEFIINNQVNQIANLITVTNNQNDIIDIRNYQHNLDSTSIEQLKIDIKEEIKNGKRKYRKGLFQGSAIGLGTGFIGGLFVR
jgi:hypothetical protein